MIIMNSQKLMGLLIGLFSVLAIIVVPKSTVILLFCLFLFEFLKMCRGEKAETIYAKDYFWVFAIILFAAIAFSWVFVSSGNWIALLKFITLAAIGCSTLLVPSRQIFSMIPQAHRYVVAGYVFGFGVICFATIFAAMTNSSLWGSYYFDPLTTLNNSAVVIALSSWIALIIVTNYSIKHAVYGFALVLTLLLFLSSLAATGALLIGALVLFFRKIAGRRAGVLMAAIAALLIVTAPSIIKISGADSFATPAGVNNVSSGMPASARHRLAMWSFASEKIDEKPWLGWGFGASRHIPQEDRRLAPNMEIMPLHPHNLALQTRLELGLPGSLILAGLVFSIFYRLATFTNDGWISGLAMAPAAGWLFVANVSYGMWQSWWIALAFLLAVFMRLALASRESSVER